MRGGFKPPKLESPKNSKTKMNPSASMLDVTEEKVKKISPKQTITIKDLEDGRPLSLTSKRDAFLYDHAQVIYYIENKKPKSRNHHSRSSKFLLTEHKQQKFSKAAANFDQLKTQNLDINVFL